MLQLKWILPTICQHHDQKHCNNMRFSINIIFRYFQKNTFCFHEFHELECHLPTLIKYIVYKKSVQLSKFISDNHIRRTWTFTIIVLKVSYPSRIVTLIKFQSVSCQSHNVLQWITSKHFNYMSLPYLSEDIFLYFYFLAQGLLLFLTSEALEECLIS